MAASLVEINREGAQKYFTDKGVYKNPYPVGSIEFNEFERGWMQSLKKDEGRLVNALPPSHHPEKRRTNVPSDVEMQAERYRSRKG
jgi:hypothetical protein